MPSRWLGPGLAWPEYHEVSTDPSESLRTLSAILLALADELDWATGAERAILDDLRAHVLRARNELYALHRKASE